MKIVNLALDLIITIVSLVLQDSRKTGRVLLKIQSIALVAAILVAIPMKRGSVWHAMKTVKPAPDLIARTVWLALNERRKTEEAHKKIQNIVLVSAPQDFINTKKAYAYHATKIVRLAQDQIVSIAWLVPKERRRTEEVLWRIQNTVFKPVHKDPLKLMKMSANQVQAMLILLLSWSFL